VRFEKDYIGHGRLRPGNMWVLFDMDNGDPSSRRYLWWFETREKARAHKKRQNSRWPSSARLAGPFRYRVYEP
jgi:hypothetical protein